MAQGASDKDVDREGRPRPEAWADPLFAAPPGLRSPGLHPSKPSPPPQAPALPSPSPTTAPPPNGGERSASSPASPADPTPLTLSCAANSPPSLLLASDPASPAPIAAAIPSLSPSFPTSASVDVPSVDSHRSHGSGGSGGSAGRTTPAPPRPASPVSPRALLPASTLSASASAAAHRACPGSPGECVPLSRPAGPASPRAGALGLTSSPRPVSPLAGRRTFVVGSGLGFGRAGSPRRGTQAVTLQQVPLLTHAAVALLSPVAAAGGSASALPGNAPPGTPPSAGRASLSRKLPSSPDKAAERAAALGSLSADAGKKLRVLRDSNLSTAALASLAAAPAAMRSGSRSAQVAGCAVTKVGARDVLAGIEPLGLGPPAVGPSSASGKALSEVGAGGSLCCAASAGAAGGEARSQMVVLGSLNSAERAKWQAAGGCSRAVGTAAGKGVEASPPPGSVEEADESPAAAAAAAAGGGGGGGGGLGSRARRRLWTMTSAVPGSNLKPEGAAAALGQGAEAAGSGVCLDGSSGGGVERTRSATVCRCECCVWEAPSGGTHRPSLPSTHVPMEGDAVAAASGGTSVAAAADLCVDGGRAGAAREQQSAPSSIAAGSTGEGSAGGVGMAGVVASSVECDVAAPATPDATSPVRGKPSPSMVSVAAAAAAGRVREQGLQGLWGRPSEEARGGVDDGGSAGHPSACGAGGGRVGALGSCAGAAAGCVSPQLPSRNLVLLHTNTTARLGANQHPVGMRMAGAGSAGSPSRRRDDPLFACATLAAANPSLSAPLPHGAVAPPVAAATVMPASTLSGDHPGEPKRAGGSHRQQHAAHHPYRHAFVGSPSRKPLHILHGHAHQPQQQQNQQQQQQQQPYPHNQGPTQRPILCGPFSVPGSSVVRDGGVSSSRSSSRSVVDEGMVSTAEELFLMSPLRL